MASVTSDTQLASELVVAQVVQRENERLTRLLRNLYQEFRLGSGDRSQLYEHICRELAQYFRCDCCQLYLLHEEPDGDCDRGSFISHETLTLTAAFGPWERALKPRFVRHLARTTYDPNGKGHTARRFRAFRARVDLSRSFYRLAEPDSEKKAKSSPSDDPNQGQSESNAKAGGSPHNPDAEWHLVWTRDNLYNVSRNIMSCPILRHRSKNPKNGVFNPYPIGLIKLENRRAFLDRVFESDFEPTGLEFGAYFELCSVAAYLADLRNRLRVNPDTIPSLFAPINDGDGWEQHYQVHKHGYRYYETVVKWQREMFDLHKVHGIEDVRNLLERQYHEASEHLRGIMNLIVEAEVFLQALDQVLVALHQGLSREQQEENKSVHNAPRPSLFNLLEVADSDQVDNPLTKRILEAILGCGDGTMRGTREAKHASIQVVQLNFGSEPSPSVNDFDSDTEDSDKYSLWRRLVSAFHERNPTDGYLLSPKSRQSVACRLCELLNEIAGQILDTEQDSKTAALSPELTAAYHCAREVAELSEWRSSDAEAQLGNITEVARLAELLAVALMYSHTFDARVDEARLYSIQSHVSQIIDNHLLEKARPLGVTFDHLELLGLTESSLEALEALEKLQQNACQTLVAFLRQFLIRPGFPKEGEPFCGVPRRVRAILDDMVDTMIAPSAERVGTELFHIAGLANQTSEVAKQFEKKWASSDKKESSETDSDSPNAVPLIRLAASNEDSVAIDATFENDSVAINASFGAKLLFASELRGHDGLRRPGSKWLFQLCHALQRLIESVFQPKKEEGQA